MLVVARRAGSRGLAARWGFGRSLPHSVNEQEGTHSFSFIQHTRAELRGAPGL